MITQRLRHIILFTITLLLTACQFEDSNDCPKEENAAASYINLTIAVSNGDIHTRTRDGEKPSGGEDGDGREAGFERENAVTGITLILYQDANGINTTLDPTLDFVRYFPVTKVESTTQGTSYDAGSAHTNHLSQIEAKYTTGPQMVGKYGVSKIDFSKTYHAIVIANYDMTGSLTEGTSTLSNVRDLTLSTIYSGDNTKATNLFTNFVMSSEEDNTLNFAADGIMTEDASGDKHYDLSDQPLVIERMAARIDFWAANSNGYKTSSDNAAYTISGYEYPVTGSETDKFVVTGIVPFNLANGHAAYGSEYLLKRLCADKDHLTADAVSYLESEKTSNYVIDPQTLAKTTGTPTLTSPLSGLYTLIGSGSDLENTTSNPYYKSIESMHGATNASSTIDGKENVVVCYPMENTLLPTTPLYYYATGIAIIGYYYQNGTGTGTRYVYLGYLRHQGEAASYNIQPSTTPLATDATMGETTAMNFGIVRNNIYRVSISSIDNKGRLELSIKVKEWDCFTHDVIYM